MHLEDFTPLYLEGLTQMELSLVARVSAVMNIHVLKGGMLAKRGHMVSLFAGCAIARALPWMLEELGLLLIYDEKRSPRTRVWSVERARVQRAIVGLCHGEAGSAPGGASWDQAEYAVPTHLGAQRLYAWAPTARLPWGERGEVALPADVVARDVTLCARSHTTNSHTQRISSVVYVHTDVRGTSSKSHEVHPARGSVAEARSLLLHSRVDSAQTRRRQRVGRQSPYCARQGTLRDCAAQRD